MFMVRVCDNNLLKPPSQMQVKEKFKSLSSLRIGKMQQEFDWLIDWLIDFNGMTTRQE